MTYERRILTPEEAEEIERAILLDMARRYGETQDAFRRKMEQEKRAAYRRAKETLKKGAKRK